MDHDVGPAQSEVIRCYEEIAPLIEGMLIHARARNWNEMGILEARLSAAIERLKTVEPAALEQPQLAKKHRLLKKILAHDAEIRDLVAPELARLGALMGSMQREKELHRAYGQ